MYNTPASFSFSYKNRYLVIEELDYILVDLESTLEEFSSLPYQQKEVDILLDKIGLIHELKDKVLNELYVRKGRIRKIPLSEYTKPFEDLYVCIVFNSIYDSYLVDKLYERRETYKQQKQSLSHSNIELDTLKWSIKLLSDIISSLYLSKGTHITLD